MTPKPPPLPASKLRPHPVERQHRLTLGPRGPWAAVITVTAVRTNHGRHSTAPHDWLHEVQVEWYGPPAPGMPAAAGPVSSRDVYVLPNAEDAIALAHKALDAYAAGGDEPPDLRDLADL